MSEFNLNETYQNSLKGIGLPFPEAGIFQGINPVGTVINTVKGAFNFRNEFNGEDFFPVEIDGWQIPDEPLISIVGSNNIVETQLIRGKRAFNVLEQVNLNSYRIRIRGTLFSNEPDIYPTEQVAMLRTLLEKKGSRDISCPRLDIYGIKRVAIREVAWPAMEGQPSQQDYQIICISDTPITLEMSENE